MKRILMAASFAAALCCAIALSSSPARAGLFGGGHSSATPTPSASPAAMPTATPEPPEIAIPRLQKALQANPNDRDAMTELATQFITIGHPEAALPLTQRLIQLGTKTGQVYYLDGSAQEAVGNMQAALADLENASDIEPTNLGVLSSLASLYVKANRMQDAERIGNRAVTFNKTDPQAYITLGGVYSAEQKWDDARKEFEQAFTLDPTNVAPLMQEAQTWVLQNTIPNALQVVDRAIAVDPKNVQVLVYRATLYARQNDLVKAAQAFDDASAAATTDADKADVATRKALMYANHNQQAQAHATFEAAIKQYPTVVALPTAYGEYLMNQKDQRHAESEFLAALQIDKNDPNTLYDMAQLKGMQGRTSDVISYLKRLSDVAPSAQTFALLGRAYVTQHDYKNAKDACAKSFQIDRTPDTLGCIAGADYSLKNFKEAAQIFDALDSAVKPFMDQNPQLLYMAGDSYAHMNQKAKAIDAYKRLLKGLHPGTREYKQVQSQMLAVNHPPKPAKKGHA